MLLINFSYFLVSHIGNALYSYVNIIKNILEADEYPIYIVWMDRLLFYVTLNYQIDFVCKCAQALNIFKNNWNFSLIMLQIYVY